MHPVLVSGSRGLLAAVATAALLVAMTANSVFAAKPASGHITVAEPVSYGGTTTATVNPGGSDVYVFVRCYTPDLDGAYVYAAYFPVSADNTAAIGPLASSLWTSGGASCTAEEGYFTRNGFGRWVVLASDRFAVTP